MAARRARGRHAEDPPAPPARRPDDAAARRPARGTGDPAREGDHPAARERGRWRDFKSARTRRGGRFDTRYRFTSGARGTFPIRAVARADAAYPYATGRSRAVRVRVG
jgi:hypothetical protein